MGDAGRGRSRSPAGTEFVSFERIEVLRETYRKTRTQRRGGKNHRRRLKSVCIGLLRIFIQLIDQVLLEFTIGNSGQRSESYYRNRRQQAVDRLSEIIHQNWLPRRDQYILDFSQCEELESEIASAIAVSTDSEGEPQVVEPSEPIGIWSASASSSSRVPTPPPYPPPSVVDRIRRASVTSSNPLIRRPKAPTPVIQPRLSEERVDFELLQRAGIGFSGNLTHRLNGIVVSLDWHQVCDTIRSKYNTLRCDDRGHYYLLDPLKEKLAELKNLATRAARIGGQPVTFVVLSYTHSRTYQDLVLNLLPLESQHLDICLTTKSRCDYGGKLWLLRQICHPSARVWHADDNWQIVKEFLERASDPGVAQVKVAAIKVPKHWRSQRAIQVHWYQSVVEALSLLIESWQANLQ